MTTNAARTTPRLVTLFGSLRPYDRAWLAQDVVAGVTLAALAVPEVLGYTKIAGTPPITGLYTLLLPVLAFAVFGSSRHLVVGGDSATAAIMYAGIASLGLAGLEPGTQQWLALAGLSALLAAGLLLVARLLRLGFLANFISRTVLVGFLAGVGVEVALTQLGAMLGIPAASAAPGRSAGTLSQLWHTLTNLSSASGATLAVALGTLAVFVVFDRWIRAVPGGLVAVVLAIAASWAFDLAARGVAVLGPVRSGLPHLGVPAGVNWGNATALLPTAGSLVLVILAQSAATSRAYAVRYRERFVENDDLVGLAAANLAAGFGSTFVVNGSPTKTEIVDEARGRTQVAQLTMAGVVAVTLLFLTKPLQYLPNAVLASVVFVIGLKLVDTGGLRDIWRLRKDEFWVAIATGAVVVCVGVEQGILLAIGLSLALHVMRHYLPRDSVVTWDADGRPVERLPRAGTLSEPGLLVYRFAVGLFYANAERLADEALQLVDLPEPPRWFVLDADAMDDVDYTGGKTLSELVDELGERQIAFAVAGASPKLRRELDRYGITAKIGRDRYFDDVGAARAAFHSAR